MARTDIVTPATGADTASNRPARLPRRQRVAAAVASCVVSGVLLGSILFGMAGFADASMSIAGAVVATTPA